MQVFSPKTRLPVTQNSEEFREVVPDWNYLLGQNESVP
jgi:hypothetical protein